MPGSPPRQSGNVFFALFGAVALLGAVGASTMAIMKGPVRSMAEVTKHTIAENAMIAAGRLSIVASAQQATQDCDGDNYVEPLPWDGPVGAAPAGGGNLPASVGASRMDPWGTNYGYCAWDHGTVIDDAACGGASQKRLRGENADNKALLTVISAGPDRMFQTSCGDSPAYITKPAGSDDIVLQYTYAESQGIAGGLWALKSGEPGTAEIKKDIEVEGGGSFGGSLALGGGLLLPDQTASSACNAATDQQLRRNTSGGATTLEICDWQDGLGDWAAIGGSGSAGGSDRQVQFNNAGALDGVPAFEYQTDGELDIIGAPISGQMLRVQNNATSGTAYGVYSQSNSTEGYGVYGGAAATSGFNYGVFGQSNSPDGTGVYGKVVASSGTNYGGYFSSNSTSGTGVYGKATASSGTTYGGYFESKSTSGTSVYGLNTAASGTVYGVHGKVIAASGPAAGVYGESNSNDLGIKGVYGLAKAGDGVYGLATGASGRGVHGYSSSLSGQSFGVWGESNSAIGRGVFGYASSPSGANYGVYGESNGTAGYGVYATNSKTTGYGLYCNSSNANGCGGNQAWYNASDARLKDHVEDLDADSGLDAVMRLRPVRYRWKNAAAAQKPQLGFLAQDVEKIFPELVGTGPDQEITTADGKKQVIENARTMSYGQIVVPLVKAVQEQQAEIQRLRARLDALEAHGKAVPETNKK